MAPKKKTSPDNDFDFLDDGEELEIDFDFDFLNANQRSTQKRKPIKNKKPPKKPHKPQPWDNDWYDPEDLL